MSLSRSLALVGGTALLLAAAVPPTSAFPAGRVTAGVGICPPGIGVGLLEVPKGSLKDPRARTYIVDSLRPGATISRKFQVCNGTPAPVTVQVYANEATVSAGSFRITEGRVLNALASWTTVDRTPVTVPSGKAEVLTATVRVPRDAESREHYAVVLAELPARPSASGVAIASRVGLRMYVDVGPGGGRASDFTVDSLQASRRPDRTPVVTARVKNTGGRALDMSGTLRLSDGPGGLSGGPFPAALGTTVAPGETAPVTIVLDKSLPAGPWLARLDMASGLLKRSVQATITFPEAAGATAAAVPAENVPFGEKRKVPILVAGGLIGLLLLFLFLFWLLAKKRIRRRDDDEDVETPQ